MFASDKDNLSGSEDDQTQFPHSQGTTQVQKKHRKSDKVPSVTKEDRGHKLKNFSRQKQGSRRVSRDSSDLTPDSDAELQDSGSNMAPSTRGSNKKKVQKKRQQSDADSDEEYDEDSSKVPKLMPQVPTTLPELIQIYAAMQEEAKGKSSSSKASAPEKIVTYAGFPQKGDDSDPIPKLIRGAIKDVVWRTKKFVTSEAQEVALAKDVYAAIDIKDKGAEGHEEAFIERYRSKCTELLNGQRSYVQGNAVKGAANDWMENIEAILPEVSEILACLSRSAPPEGEEALARWKKVWVWYWDVYLPFIAGNKFHWNESKRHYECISESAVVGSGDVKPSAAKKAKKAGKKTPQVALNVPPSTEAFAMVMFENCRTKWMEEYPVKIAHPGKNSRSLKRKQGHEGLAYAVDGRFLNFYDKKFKGIYTQNDSGHAKFGGWKVEGIKKFIEYRKESVMARTGKERKANTLALEAQILALVREKHGVVGVDLAAQRAARNQARAGNQAPEVEEVDDLDYEEE